MFDTTHSEPHHSQSNNGSATNRILFPLNLLSLPELICSHTGPMSAAQTHSHSPTIIMMCPVPPIHGSALLYTAVCQTCTPSHTHRHKHSPQRIQLTKKTTDAHTRTDMRNHKNPVWNAHTHKWSTQIHRHTQPNAVTHLTCQS